MNEGGLVFVEGVKLTEVEIAEGVKLAEPDLLIACVSPVHLFFNIFICLHQQNSLQAYYNDSQYHIPEPYYYLVKRYIILVFIINKRDAYTLLESRRGCTGRRCCMYPKF